MNDARSSAESEHMTLETIEAAFDEWRKTLKVIDRPSNQDIFGQGYVAGWNAKDAAHLEAIRKLVALFDDEGNLKASFEQIQGAVLGGFDILAAAAQGEDNIAKGSLPPLVDRAELIALLEDLASVNMTRDACERQARRMADDLIARGLFTAPQTVEVTDEDWKRALDCGHSCLPTVTRAELDNAMQHAFGILSLVRLNEPQTAPVPWKGNLSVRGPLSVQADGVTLIDEAGICWALVFPDKNGFYDHASTIVSTLSRPERDEPQAPALTNEYQRCMDMLGDVPGATLEDKLTTYIGEYMALQLAYTPAPAPPAGSAPAVTAREYELLVRAETAEYKLSKLQESLKRQSTPLSRPERDEP